MHFWKMLIFLKNYKESYRFCQGYVQLWGELVEVCKRHQVESRICTVNKKLFDPTWPFFFRSDPSPNSEFLSNSSLTSDFKMKCENICAKWTMFNAFFSLFTNYSKLLYSKLLKWTWHETLGELKMKYLYSAFYDTHCIKVALQKFMM